MGGIIRIVEIDHESGQLRRRPEGAARNLEIYAVPEPLATALMRFVVTGTVDDLELFGSRVETRQWFIAPSRGCTGFDEVQGVLKLNVESRATLAALCLRMRYEVLQIGHVDGFEVVADHELRWAWDGQTK